MGSTWTGMQKGGHRCPPLRFVCRYRCGLVGSGSFDLFALLLLLFDAFFLTSATLFSTLLHLGTQ